MNSARRRRALAACAAAGLIASLPGAAHAQPGDEAPAAYGFVARIQVGAPGPEGSRACTGVLVAPRALLTSGACLSDLDRAVTVRFADGATNRVVDVQPDRRPGLALATLARPVRTAVAPRATAAAAAGESLRAAGFGRTADAWVPERAHLSSFTVSETSSAQVRLTPGEEGGAGLCAGDAGAALVRDNGTTRELVALATAAGQRGCLGAPDGATGDVIANPVAGLTLPAATADPYDQLTLAPADSGTAPVANAGFGTAVAMADFNKDGYPDIAVGAPRDGTGAGNSVASGTVTVFAGGANGPGVGTRLLQTRFNAADEADDRFGSALATGDFNKDGYADLAVGTPGEVVGTIKAGSIAVFNGSASGLNQARGIDQNDIGRTDGAGDLFGKSLAAGDFNGDGFTDLAVGAPGKVLSSLRSGEVTVLKGSASGLAFGWLVDQRGGGGANEAGDLFGESLAAGNVLGAKTGTVFSDLVIGSPGEAPGSDPQSGGIYVFPGSTAGPVSGGLGESQSGNGGSNESGDRFGAAVGAADFNKDGWADVVVGSPGEAPGTDPQSGTVTILPGGNTALGVGFAVAGKEVTGGDNGQGDLFGNAVATGDTNADGFADLLVGVPGKAGNAGRLYLWTGQASTTAQPRSLTPRTMIRQEDVFGTSEAGDQFGAALAFADLNRDGRADALVGSPGEAAPGEPAAGTATTLSRVFGTP